MKIHTHILIERLELLLHFITHYSYGFFIDSFQHLSFLLHCISREQIVTPVLLLNTKKEIVLLAHKSIWHLRLFFSLLQKYITFRCSLHIYQYKQIIFITINTLYAQSPLAHWSLVPFYTDTLIEHFMQIHMKNNTHHEGMDKKWVQHKWQLKGRRWKENQVENTIGAAWQCHGWIASSSSFTFIYLIWFISISSYMWINKIYASWFTSTTNTSGLLLIFLWWPKVRESRWTNFIIKEKFFSLLLILFHIKENEVTGDFFHFSLMHIASSTRKPPSQEMSFLLLCPNDDAHLLLECKN